MHVNILVDAMGGDNAPDAVIKGAVKAAKGIDAEITLVGTTEIINAKAKEFFGKDTITEVASNIKIHHTTECIEMEDIPTQAIKTKKDSSMVVGFKLLKEGKGDAFVSAGNSGALLTGATLLVGRIKGIERPPLAPLIPTKDGVALLIDCGANVDARATHLLQFAKMGSVYMEHVVGIKNPRVALVNIGAEEEKGNALVKETMPLLKNCTDINFIGSIEARDIPSGYADVIVCEAFTGNVILKLYEGIGSVMLGKIKESLMSSLKTKIGAILIKPALKKTLKSFNTEEYGGAPLLGLNGLVVKTHGNSTANEVKNSIIQCVSFKKEKINEKIKEKLLIEQN